MSTLLFAFAGSAFAGDPADSAPATPDAAEPLALFRTPAVGSGRIYEQARRALTSYPDMVRWRLVGVRTDIVRAIFGSNVRKPESTGHPFGGHQTYFHKPAKGEPKRYLELNFFDDASYEGLIGTTSVAQSDGQVHYYIGTRLSAHDDGLSDIDISLVNDLHDDWQISITYHGNDDLLNFYSLRRLKGTPYYLVMERNRGRRSYGKVTIPEADTRNGGPLVLADRFTGIHAEIGPIIDYGLADFSFGDARHGYVLGTFSGRPVRAFRTADGGKSWQPLGIESNWVPREIYFLSHDVGFLSLQFKPIDGGVGSVRGCALLKTNDGGRSWERLEQDGSDLCVFKIQFGARGAAFGFGRLRPCDKWQVLQSVDGGLTWRPYYSLPDDLLGVTRIETIGDKVVVFSRSGVVWAHEPALVLDQAGRLVREVTTGYPSTKAIEFVTDGIIFGHVLDELGQYLIRSTDGGLTWHRIFEGDFELLYAISEHEVAILLRKGPDSPGDTSSSVAAVAYTANGGRTWREGKKVRGLSLSTAREVQKLDDGSKLLLGGNYILTLSPATN